MVRSVCVLGDNNNCDLLTLIRVRVQSLTHGLMFKLIILTQVFETEWALEDSAT